MTIREDWDGAILVWNGLVTRTERAQAGARSTRLPPYGRRSRPPAKHSFQRLTGDARSEPNGAASQS
jgi:hypothetical protein